MALRFSTLLSLSLAATALPLWSARSAGPVPAPGAASPVRLAPHRAVYDLSLVTSREMRGVESARGRIAFDLTGNACEGYSLKFRQVTVIEGGESGTKTTDLRTANYESGDGRTFRFRNESSPEGGPKTSVDGDAERRPNGLAVRLRAPKKQTASLDADALFPNAQMRDLIVAAREGRKLVATKLYDGSDDGRKVFETLAVIGDRITPKPDEALEEAARSADLEKLPRWPVTLSYFAQARGDQAPAYVLSFEMYDNGVSRALKLDYGDFVLKGEMVRLDLLPEARPCGR